MRNHVAKIFALLMLIGVAQTLSACVIEEDHDHYYHHHWHDHDDDDWHRR